MLLHESEAKPRTSVNNNDNLQVQWDLSGFYPMLLMCTTMASVYRLPLFFEMICNLCDVCNSIIGASLSEHHTSERFHRVNHVRQKRIKTSVD